MVALPAMQRLRTEAEVEQAFASPRYLLFKHSTRCPISAGAFEEFHHWSAAHPDAAAGWIDVIEERALSQAVAARTGVRHQSPQAILLENGRPTWNASHDAITVESLERSAVKPGAPKDPR